MNQRELGETMSCKEFVELVTDYLEGRMPREDADRFEAHIVVCPPCGYYLEQMRTTLGVLGRIPEETVSDDARSELLHAFAEWHSHD